MTEITKVDAIFRIRGNTLDPDEVTRVLGLSPSFSLAKGAVDPRTNEKQPIGVWLLKSVEGSPGKGLRVVDQRLCWLLDQLEGKADIVRGLVGQGYLADFYCSCYMQSENEGTELTPTTIKRMADLGASLNLSVWVPNRLL